MKKNGGLPKPSINEKLDDDVVGYGKELRDNEIRKFQNILSSFSDMRVLIHRPKKSWSAGGYSLFSNLGDSMDHLGIQVDYLTVGDDPSDIFQKFRPSHFLSSDHDFY